MMEKMLKKNILVIGNILLPLFVFGGIFVMNTNTVFATDFQPDCPFGAQTGRTIVHFEDQVLSGGLRSDVGADRAYKTAFAFLPAGTYDVSLQSFDGGLAADRGDQPNEKYYLQLKSGSTIVAQTNSTNELPDHVSTPVWYGKVNSGLVLSQSVNTIVAAHSVYPDTSSSNSVNVGCVAFDLVTPPPVTLTGSCSVNPSSINIGGSLTWSASVSGGTGLYTYSWAGTDSLFASGSSISKQYFSVGTKIGTVTITSGSQSVVRSCSAVVNAEEEDDLFVSCSVSPSSVDIDEDVTWRSTASGGTGSYSYDWSGTDGLDGSSRNITWSYDDNGTKHGTVTVTSGGQSASASCTVRVDEEEDDDLSISCYASPSNPQIGSRMNWYVRVSGGDGDYDYDWSGTDGLNSSSRSPSMTYYNPGSKRATVIVSDGNGNEDSDTCYVNLNQNSVLAFSQVNQTPLVSAVSLSQVPYTGLADNFRLYFFVLILALFSAWMAYVVISYKSEKGELN